MTGVEKFQTLIDHVKAGCPGGHQTFDIRFLNHSLGDEPVTGNTCGTCGCAAGELPVLFPDEWRWKGHMIEWRDNQASDWLSNASEFFELPINFLHPIFIPSYYLSISRERWVELAQQALDSFIKEQKEKEHGRATQNS